MENRQADSSGTHLNVIGPEDLDYVKIERLKASKKMKKSGKYRKFYKDIICTFDIETSRLPGDHAIMYIWQAQIGEYTVIGRTWDEFLWMLERLNRAAERSGMVILIYVHNLSYEFQFLSGILEPENVFCLKSRSVLKFDWNSIEFRCSYKLTNLSLGAFTAQMGVPDEKLAGFDYKKIRYPWTPLTDDELHYCINDVKGLAQAIKVKLDLNGDTLATIPLTATGYARREAKREMTKFNWHQLHDMMPKYAIYQMAREAFRGGDTHANRYYAGQIVEHAQSYDRSSSYPEVMLNREFPASAFYRMPKGKRTLADVLDLIKRRKALLLRVGLRGVTLADRFEGCPYLSKSKCRHIVGVSEDNGRVLSAEYLETTITDVDLIIILDMYEVEEFAFYDIAYARYKKLPFPLRDLLKKYYTGKTQLKNVEGQELYYQKFKELLNSFYGMCAQDPGKITIMYSNKDGFYALDPISKEDFEYKMRMASLSYSWAPWVTAWARYELHEGRKLAGRRFVYCDTDSIKYDADPEKPWPQPDFTEYNLHKIALAEKTGAWADDPAGDRHYMGVYEYEGESRLKTLGAKKYCTETDGKIKLTCAGVGKKAGSKAIQEAGGLEAFQEGFIFDGEAGGLEAVYNDDDDFWMDVDGHRLHVTKNVCLRPSTYRLGITEDYRRCLAESHKILRIIRDTYERK